MVGGIIAGGGMGIGIFGGGASGTTGGEVNCGTVGGGVVGTYWSSGDISDGGSRPGKKSSRVGG